MIDHFETFGKVIQACVVALVVVAVSLALGAVGLAIYLWSQYA